MSDTFLGGLDLETSIYVFQGVSTVLAIITNLFLVYVIKNHTRNQIGNYKYLLITFALFEAFYSVVVFIGMPTHFMADRTWLVFTSKGLLGGTKYAAFGPGLYCFLYDTWVELVVIHFIYRYIVVCKERWAYAINERRYLKFLIGLVYFTNLAYYALCAAGFCQHEKILPKSRCGRTKWRSTDDGFSFGKVSMVFSLLTSINKFCDPFIVICCINQYRKATAKILHSIPTVSSLTRELSVGCGSSIGATSSSSEDQHNTRTGATATTTHGTKMSIHNIGVVEIEYKGQC